MIRVGYIAALAFAAGLGSGAAITHKLMSGAEAKAQLQDVQTSVAAAREARTHQHAVAAEFETARERIETNAQEAADGLQPYLEARPDLRAIDLGDQWLCLVATADGQPCGPTTGRTDGAVPATAAAGSDAGTDAARVPGSAPAVPAVRGAARGIGKSGESGSGESR